MNPSLEEPSFDEARTRRAWWTVAAAAVIAGSVWAWGNFHRPTPQHAAAPARPAFPWNRPDLSNAANAMSPEPHQTAIAPSTDRALMIDGNGHLQVSRSVRNLFDSYLDHAGTQPLPAVRGRIVAYLNEHLPKMAAGEAQALLDQYLAYNAALRALSQTGAVRGRSADDRQSRLYVIENLRARHFSAAEQAAFFGDDLVWEQYAVAHAQALQDPAQNVVDKAWRIKQLRNQLPAALRAKLTPAADMLDVGTLTDQWRASKGTPQELRAMREALVGVTGADQLEAQDRQAQVWGKQLSSFGEQIKATMADPTLSAVERQQTLAELRKQNLAELERLGSLPPGSLKP